MRWASFGPTPGPRATEALSPVAMAVARLPGSSTERMPSATLAPTPWTRLEQAEPLALRIRAEAEEADHVLAHMGLDGQNRRLAGGRQVLEGAGGAMDHVADAVHVEDHEILAVGIDHALEFADHVCLCSYAHPRGSGSGSVTAAALEACGPP